MTPKRSSLIVVSNRLPISISTENDEWNISPSSGGLASALRGVKNKIDFKWIGWPGTSFFPNQQDEIREKLNKQNLFPVFINREQEEHFYHSFCNSILWPLFHYFTDHMAHSSKSWKFYQDVNEIFADEVIKNAEKEATVWVHDFHLMLLPSLLKERRPDLKIGFFLHIPFPSSEIYRMFPKREHLLRGVLGADYIGFHTSDYATHFRLACLRVLGLDSNQEGISYLGRRIGVGTHPIGMNIAAFDKVLDQPEFSTYIQEIQQRYKSNQVILGVERLDYTKGIALKLKAFEKLLEQNPSLVGHVILLQIIVPCRHDSLEYQKHRCEIEKEIGRINGKYSKPGFTPIQYLYRSIPLDELIALYCLADVCMIASLRDGMNLVAQEFVYSASRVSSSGALLLSEFAGASHHLPHALMINPLDIDSMAKSIKTALLMPANEKSEKLKKMAESVKALDSPLWAENFLEKLESVASKQSRSLLDFSSLEMQKLLAASKRAKHRTLILDYDGTLRELTSFPMEASPTPELMQLLSDLVKLKDTDVHIVSGRDHVTLQNWLGTLSLFLSAEHGYLKKKPEEIQWSSLQNLDLGWMNYVREILDKAVEEVPGSFLEVKDASLSWHYRMTDLDYGQWRAKELFTSLTQDLSNLPVEIIPGKQVIEVRAQGVSKAKYVHDLFNKHQDGEFILCIGDDRTDQEMYSALPPHAFSVHVGEGEANTTFHLESPQKVRSLLRQIIAINDSSEISLLDQ